MTGQRRHPRWKRLDDLPMGGKLLVLISLSSAVGLVVAAGILIAFASSALRTSTVRDLRTLANIMADSSSAALVFRDPRAAADTLDSLRAHADIERACLYRSATPDAPPQAGAFAAFVREAAAPCPAAPAGAPLIQDSDRLTVVLPVTLSGEQVGTLELTQDLRRQRGVLWLLAQVALAIGAVSFMFSAGVAWLMQRAITGPLLRLAQTAQRITETRDYELRVAPAGQDEVGRLIQDFNQMLDEVEQAESKMRHLNLSLEEQVTETRKALNQLRDAQTQLVQSEKLASLGALVAGMSHEINTPLGVGVSAASTLQVLAEQIREKHDSGQMTRTDLKTFVQLAIDSSDLVLKNLQRAAELMRSFKQVAVDQASGERRKFPLKPYLDEIITSLSPQFKGKEHRVSVECPSNLVVDGYPGALAQIVTNFITNSLMHAFPHEKRGEMRIEVTDGGGDITLRYRDNGVGIDPAHLGRVFEPFFTTRRGTGGSGLGLSVVHNLATRRLGGTVEVRSEPGRGAEFTLRFPAQQPETEQA